MPDFPIDEKVRAFLERLSIGADDGIVIACSGGADSTALTVALHRVCSGIGNPLVCALLEHGIRPAEEVAREARSAESTALTLGIPFRTFRIEQGEIEQRCRESGRGTEAVARDARYAFLRSVAAESDARFIAMGHTQDDQIETVLMRVFQGSGPQGLKGIPAVRGEIIRPLLDSTREEILAYLEETGFGYVNDPSNDQPLYLRNRIRKTVVPAAFEVFPGMRESLRVLAEKMAGVSEALDGFISNTVSWEAADGEYRCARRAFDSLPPYARYHSLVRMILHVGSAPDRVDRIPYRFFKPILRTAMESDDGRVVLRGYGIELIRSGESYRLRPLVADTGVKDYLFTIVPDAVYELGHVCLLVRAYEGQSPYSRLTWFPASELSPPVVVRSRREGDFIRLAGGRKSLKKLLSEEGIPPAERWTVPIIVDRIGVVAVLGGHSGARDFVRHRVVSVSGNTDSTVIWQFVLSDTGDFL